MKVYILNTGYLETDENGVVGCSVIGTKSQPHVQNKWIKLPVMAFLIETDNGYILYDTGSNPNAMNGYWQKIMQEVYPLYQTKEERLENQLALCGVKPEDINTVILSHMHLDHAGNINLFPHADVYVPKEDYMQGLVMVHQNPDPEKHGGYIKGDLEAPVKQYHLIDEDFEIAPGVDVLCLPGHTPNLLGVVVHLQNQTLILPQDCVYTSAIYGPPARMSGFLYDSLSFFKSIEKVRALEKKYDAKVIFAHDYEFFKTLDLAPKFYE
jgi:glyoxylase-like metal-dependent hydrolase (beta-lactamase superfamily II)